MNKCIVSLLLLSSASVLFTTTAFAGVVCGNLYKTNPCRTLEGCPKFYLRDAERGPDGNPYLVEPSNDEVSNALERNAGRNLNVCVKGVVGANGDPDLIVATGVHAK